jgi:hypothetical protein
VITLCIHLYECNLFRYRSGFGLSELNGILSTNRAVLSEAVDDEESDQIKWRKQSDHHKSHLANGDSTTTKKKNNRNRNRMSRKEEEEEEEKERYHFRTINMKNRNSFEDGNDSEDKEYNFWTKKINDEFELQEDEVTLRSVSQPPSTNGKENDDDGNGDVIGGWNGRLYEIDMTSYTSEWSSSILKALLEDQLFYEDEYVADTNGKSMHEDMGIYIYMFTHVL